MKSFIYATALTMMAGAAFADASTTYDVDATIVDHYYSVPVQGAPYTDVRCEDVRVPVNHRGGDAGDVLGGMIIGGLLGKGVTGNDRGAAVGAVIGGMVGAENGHHTDGYRIERQCREVTLYRDTYTERYSHSTITFYVNGNTYSVDFTK